MAVLRREIKTCRASLVLQHKKFAAALVQQLLDDSKTPGARSPVQARVAELVTAEQDIPSTGLDELLDSGHAQPVAAPKIQEGSTQPARGQGPDVQSVGDYECRVCFRWVFTLQITFKIYVCVLDDWVGFDQV